MNISDNHKNSEAQSSPLDSALLDDPLRVPVEQHVSHEKHYKLVKPDELSADELQSYFARSD